MARSEARESNSQGDESILAMEFVRFVLGRAKENLRKDAALQPMLFVRFKSGESGIMPLALPVTTAQKEAYFAEIGLAMLKRGKRIDEAVFVSETWYVMAEQDERLTLDVAP